VLHTVSIAPPPRHCFSLRSLLATPSCTDPHPTSPAHDCPHFIVLTARGTCRRQRAPAASPPAPSVLASRPPVCHRLPARRSCPPMLGPVCCYPSVAAPARLRILRTYETPLTRLPCFRPVRLPPSAHDRFPPPPPSCSTLHRFTPRPCARILGSTSPCAHPSLIVRSTFFLLSFASFLSDPSAWLVLLSRVPGASSPPSLAARASCYSFAWVPLYPGPYSHLSPTAASPQPYRHPQDDPLFSILNLASDRPRFEYIQSLVPSAFSRLYSPLPPPRAPFCPPPCTHISPCLPSTQPPHHPPATPSSFTLPPPPNFKHSTPSNTLPHCPPLPLTLMPRYHKPSLPSRRPPLITLETDS
jgi:hypothetical protein